MSSEDPEIPMKKPCVMEMEAGTYWWCSCGKSEEQPFCDGSHKGSCFSPIKVELNDNRKIAWCGCKKSEKQPYCDGAHKKLS